MCDNTTFIEATATWNSGGGCMIDFVILNNQHFIAISEDSLCVYKFPEPLPQGKDLDEIMQDILWQDNGLKTIGAEVVFADINQGKEES